MVSAVAGVALIALAILVKRRRASKKSITPPPPPPIHDVNNLEQGRDEPQLAQPPSYSAVLAVGNGDDKSPSHQHDASPHRHMPVEAGGVDVGDIVPSSVPPALALPAKSSAEHGTHAVEDCGTECAVEDGGAGLAGKDTADSSAQRSLATTNSVATTSTADVSTYERAELAQFHQRQSAASIASGSQPDDAPAGSDGASSAADCKKPPGDIGLGHAVLAAAQELAHHCQVPGISEAAAVVCIMANLVTDSRENDSASSLRLRQSRSVVTVLKRAAKVVGRVS